MVPRYRNTQNLIFEEFDKKQIPQLIDILFKEVPLKAKFEKSADPVDEPLDPKSLIVNKQTLIELIPIIHLKKQAFVPDKLTLKDRFHEPVGFPLGISITSFINNNPLYQKQ